ncbi:sensor histidine kinase [Geminisphaera colitermitum]|uniref:sensor histidine kinase n=1 Tax=Geminisphaera colitermitum TaxID=1148786 RepID=UPI0001965363|nr:histidine kinase [Geminisphaera colitermitum]
MAAARSGLCVRILRRLSLVVSNALHLVVSNVLQILFHSTTRRTRLLDAAESARLHLLQVQIGTHFLGNTLANASALLDHDVAKARLLLAELTNYLEGILLYTRHDEVTLADEIDTVESYLEIQRIRLGGRLHWSLDIPPALLWQPIMPLLLLPLVENAVTHGIGRQTGPGGIHLRAWSFQAPDTRRPFFRLRRASPPAGVWSVEVTETGNDDRCMPPPPSPPPGPSAAVHPGHGIAIGNIRERLRIRHGTTARLDLEKDPDSGRVSSRLTLPLVTIDAPEDLPPPRRSARADCPFKQAPPP